MDFRSIKHLHTRNTAARLYIGQQKKRYKGLVLDILYIEKHHYQNKSWTEIVMQYGGFRSSVTCVTTSFSNACFASLTHITNQSLDKGSWDFNSGKYVYRVSPINVQLVTDLVIIPAKKEHGCSSSSESLDKQEQRDILHCHVERPDQSSAVAEWTER